MTTRRTHARPFVRIGTATAAAGLLTLGLAAPASAHVGVTSSETAAGAYALLTFSVPHGCDGSPTTEVRISIPEGINAVTPTRNAFYTVTKESQQLDPPVTDAHGNEITERISVVTYTARTALPDGYRDGFDLSLQLPDAEGETLAFPVIQTCRQGRTDWTEIPAAGQSEDDLELPAPSVTITAAGDSGHAGDVGEDVALTADGSDASTEPATETAAGEGDGDGNGLAVAGLVAGLLGLVAGGAALARSGRKV